MKARTFKRYFFKFLSLKINLDLKSFVTAFLCGNQQFPNGNFAQKRTYTDDCEPRRRPKEIQIDVPPMVFSSFHTHGLLSVCTL